MVENFTTCLVKLIYNILKVCREVHENKKKYLLSKIIIWKFNFSLNQHIFFKGL